VVRVGEPGGGADAGRRVALELGEGPVVHAAATRARPRGGVRPEGGEPVPAHGAVPSLARGPRPRPAHVPAARGAGARGAPRDPASCTYEQLEEPVRYDLTDILPGAPGVA